MDHTTGDSPTLGSALSGAGGIVAGRYHVRARLGRGGSKEVYLAYDTRLDREVALALVIGAGDSAAARARVEREARVTGRLGDHPNVITVYDTGEIDGVPYLVLRAMQHGSLADALDDTRVSLPDAIRIGREIAAALAHAHAHGVVHRDVKPDNVWLALDGSAALGDFGIAHEVGADRLTAEGVVVGTVRYLSPEQIRGDEVGPATDLYALGVTLYELVTGRAPFTGQDPAQVLAQHLTAEPVPPSELEPAVSRALERLILELLAKAPAQRPASAADVAETLTSMSGTPPTQQRPPDARRVVSVLAARADIGDPEALHRMLDRCVAVIEQHGGTVERYLGDAVVGLFGATESHEDDAMRATRAAVELRGATADLRVGIEAGEVFLGAGPRGATIVTGAAITEAGRLAERAGEGEILLGEQARRSLAPAARVDPANGRLVELQVEQPALLQLPRTPFVGRARELGELQAAFAHACDEGVCRLVTVVGPPGIGKSRLAGEFLATLGDDATVLAGRCLAYGEGTTYGALAEIVGGLSGDPRRRIEELLAGDQQAVRGIFGAIGLSDEPVHVEETSWALRRLLERLARERPLVVAVEDIHWAQGPLLELLDHVVAFSSGSPILLVCLTRPELLESRPGWGAPQPNRSVLMLDALADAEARELAERLGAEDVAVPIARRAEGNPLFVEQLVAVDAGHDESALPVSIQAVLAARIDRLEPGERMLLHRASVEGRTFHAGALATLVPARETRGVHKRLVDLTRKGLIAADRPEFAGEDAFRFTHALIREAAYAGVPKQLRAELHTSVADWLEGRPGAADEIVGHHLERACRLAAEIGRSGEHELVLAGRAVERLEAASRTALTRGDPSTATALLERGIALVQSDEAARGALLPALGASLFEAGRMTEATSVLDEAIARAPEPRLEAHARVEREFLRLETDTSVGTDHARRVADYALPLLERARDDRGRSRVWSLRAHVAWIEGRVGDADAAWRQAAECARRAGDERALFECYRWRATAAVFGPTPVDEAIRLCEQLRDIVDTSPFALASMDNPLASLHAMKGEVELAERFLQEASETLHQLGGLGAVAPHHEALVWLLAGRPELAERPLRVGVETLQSMSDSDLLATTTAMLAQAVFAQGRLAEADELCRVAADTAGADDIVTQVIWRGVKARILAREGSCRDAEALSRDAVALMEPTDLLSHRGDAMLDLADVLRGCSRADEARRAVRSGLLLYEQKGNSVGAARARALLNNS